MLPSKSSEPFGISQSICTRTLRNLTRYLHRNPLEPQQASSPPKPSRTSQGLCTGTFRNLTKHLLRQNLPEPHKVSAPEPSGTSQGICTGTLRNRTEPSGASAGIFTRSLRNLVRNLVLKLHRIAPELIWAKDPIAKFCCWGKKGWPMLNVYIYIYTYVCTLQSTIPNFTMFIAFLTLQTCRLHWHWPLRIFQYQYWRPAQQSRWPLQMGWRLRAKEILSALRGRPSGFHVIWGWWIRSSPQDSACPTWSQAGVLGRFGHCSTWNLWCCLKALSFQPIPVNHMNSRSETMLEYWTDSFWGTFFLRENWFSSPRGHARVTDISRNLLPSGWGPPLEASAKPVTSHHPAHNAPP